jgi:hypothetical protein
MEGEIKRQDHRQGGLRRIQLDATGFKDGRGVGGRGGLVPVVQGCNPSCLEGRDQGIIVQDQSR